MTKIIIFVIDKISAQKYPRNHTMGQFWAEFHTKAQESSKVDFIWENWWPVKRVGDWLGICWSPRLLDNLGELACTCICFHVQLTVWKSVDIPSWVSILDSILKSGTNPGSRIKSNLSRTKTRLEVLDKGKTWLEVLPWVKLKRISPRFGQAQTLLVRCYQVCTST